MISKKGGLLITALGVVSFLFSIIYMASCTQPLDPTPWKCNYVECKNGGKCDSAKCKCPVGFEGTDCSIVTTEKYIAYWHLTALTQGSDSVNLIGTSKTYDVQIEATATNTTLFMNNFDNNPNYSSIICRIDSTDKNVFTIDTTSVLNMYYDHYRIRGGWGVMYNNDSIAGKIYVRRLNSTVNWQNDTLVLSFNRRK